MTALWIS